MSVNTSWASLALTQEKAFSQNKQDTTISKIGKFSAAKTITTSSFAFAVVETALSTIAQIFLAPLYFISPKNYSIITQHTKDSFETAIVSVRQTLGVLQSPKLSHQRGLLDLKNLMISSKDFFSEKAIIALDFGKEHKKAVSALALTTFFATCYFFFPERIYNELCKNASNAASRIYNNGVQLISSTPQAPSNHAFMDVELPVSIKDSDEYSAPKLLIGLALITVLSGFVFKS